MKHKIELSLNDIEKILKEYYKDKFDIQEIIFRTRNIMQDQEGIVSHHQENVIQFDGITLTIENKN